MSEEVKGFGDTAKGLAKNPLGIIALFIVLVYGFAALVTTFSGSLSASERLPLIWFLVLFPVLVLAVFSWLVSRHGGKLYGPASITGMKKTISGCSCGTLRPRSVLQTPRPRCRSNSAAWGSY